MNNLGAALAKLIAMTTGAALGILLAHLYEKVYNERLEEQSQRDKTRYAQGLTPIERSRTYSIEYVQEYQEGPEV
ncbi:MAG TPA: hypothetical protein VFN02_14015 [Ktedonobacteraceae bacterium]|nr:hypothetical protein [Ktedonobacteraceae bacterium]